MTKHKKDEYKCPLEATMDIIGGKYKGVIISIRKMNINVRLRQQWI